jgi:hypothetical protein
MASSEKDKAGIENRSHNGMDSVSGSNPNIACIAARGGRGKKETRHKGGPSFREEALRTLERYRQHWRFGFNLQDRTTTGIPYPPGLWPRCGPPARVSGAR